MLSKLCGLAFAFGGVAFVQAQTTQNYDRTAEKPFRVMTCNVRTPQKKDDDGGNGWLARKRLCLDIIRKYRPNIIGLQECTLEQFRDLQTAFPGYQSYSLNSESPLSTDPHNGILISPRFSLITAAGYWLSESPHVPGSRSWDSSKHPRVVNWVRLHDHETGREFRLLNSHFDHKGEVARLRSAELVVSDAAAFPSAYPQIFCGDLNAGASNPCIKALKLGGWLDSYEQLHGPTDPGFTAHDFLGDRFSPGEKRREKIDWIFYRGSLKPVSSSIVRDKGDRYPSDHYFVITEFVFSDRP